MKYEICESYKKPILLSEFNLEQNTFTNEWLNGFFLTPIVRDMIIIGQDNQLITKNLYINFSEAELPSNLNSNQLFKQLNADIKKHIFKDWEITNKVYPIYNFYGIKSNDKSKKKFLFIFLSPNKSNQIFNFEAISNRDKLVQNILELLLKSTLIEKINQQNPIATDICSGKIFLNPEITASKKTGTHFANVFSYHLSYKNLKLSFTLKNEHFRLESDKSKIQLYDDTCFINKFKYEKKEDARAYGRLFLDFKNFENLKSTKFITQLELYKSIVETLNKFNINYKKTIFSPQYLYNNFSSFENELRKVNVYISEKEKIAFENDLIAKGFQNGFANFLEYFKINKNIEPTVIFEPSFQNLLENRKEANLFLMYGESYKNEYVSSLTDNEELTKWNDPIIPFLEKELYKLTQDEFINSIKSFDVYSQVKMFNIYAGMKGLEPIVSQGLILDDSLVFYEPIKNNTEEEKKKSSKTNTKKKEKKYPSNSTISIIKKIINELNIKFNLFVNKNFYFEVNFNEVNHVSNFDNIKIIQMLPKEKNKLYSILNLQKTSDKKGKKNCFQIVSYQILMDKEIDTLNLMLNVAQEFKLTDNLIIIDNNYLIRVKDNDLMPSMILEEKNFNISSKDPALLIEHHIMNGTSLSTPVSKKSGANDNLFFPYNIPVIKTIIGRAIKNKKGYANCLLDFSDDELKMFMTLSNAGINVTMPKNNRLENIQLLKLKDFCYKKESWEGNEQILYFYLSTLTFDYLNINELAKKSLLNKLTDVVLVN